MENRILEKFDDLSKIEEFALLPKIERMKLAVEIVKLEYLSGIGFQLDSIDSTISRLG